MNAIARYNETFKSLHGSTSDGFAMFKALEQFNAEDRKVIASRFHEIFDFRFERSFSKQDLVRRNLKALSPDADLSWIPNWRDGYDAYVASTQNKS